MKREKKLNFNQKKYPENVVLLLLNNNCCCNERHKAWENITEKGCYHMLCSYLQAGEMFCVELVPSCTIEIATKKTIKNLTVIGMINKSC